MTSYTTLFEQQSYNDALAYYMETLSKNNLTVWDYVVLTASNDAQALAYDVQIKHRQEKSLLPKNTKFVVIADRDGKRIGSGGGEFLQVLLKKGVSKDNLKERLYEVFKDSGVDVWKCEIIKNF